MPPRELLFVLAEGLPGLGRVDRALVSVAGKIRIPGKKHMEGEMRRR